MAWLSALYNKKLGYSAMDDRTLAAGFSGAGMRYGATFDWRDLSVGPGSGMYSNISSGRAIVDNSFANAFPVQGSWVIRNDNAIQCDQPHPPNSSGNPRIDLVYVRVYDSDTGGDTSDGVSTLVMAGTPTAGANFTNRSGAPQIPGISLTNSIPLAYVLVPSGSTGSSSFSYIDLNPVMFNPNINYTAGSLNAVAMPGCTTIFDVGGVTYSLPYARWWPITCRVINVASSAVTLTAIQGGGIASGASVVTSISLAVNQGMTLVQASGATWFAT